MLDARRLRILCVVAEEGSLTAAADRLYLTQSAVSQQMAILEREAGLPLLERLPRGTRLTPAGEFLADGARAVIADLGTLERRLRELAEGRRRVRLGTFSTAGVQIIPALVGAYRERDASARLLVTPCQPGEAAAQLQAGQIDVALVWDYDFAPRTHAGLSHEHLLEDPLQLLLPAGHHLATADGPRRLADGATEPWVVRHHRAPYEDAFPAMCRLAGFEPDVVFHSDDYQSLQGLVAAHVGLAVAPTLSLWPGRRDVTATPFDSPAVVRRIGAVWLPDSRRDPAVRELLDVLAQVVAMIPKEV